MCKTIQQSIGACVGEHDEITFAFATEGNKGRRVPMYILYGSFVSILCLNVVVLAILILDVPLFSFQAPNMRASAPYFAT